MSKYTKTILFIALCLTAGLLWGDFALAQTPDLGLEYADELELADEDPRVAAVRLVRLALTFIGIIAVVIVLYGGFLWMTAAGDAQRVDKAKKVLLAAIIGLVIILSAFLIVNFIINRMSEALTGGPCEDGAPRECGCGGTRTCVDGVWGPCLGSDCSLDPSDTIFRVRSTYPANESSGIVRNVNMRAFLNRSVDESMTQDDLNENFRAEQIEENVDPDTLEGTVFGPLEIALTDVALLSSRRTLSVKSSAPCGDERDTQNCLPAWGRFRVSVNGGFSDIIAVGGQALDCSNGLCQFEFITSDLIDTDGPQAGIIPTQICADDGTLDDDANLVGAWGRDDVGIAEMRFFEDGGIRTMVHNEPGSGLRYQYYDHQYDTTLYSVGDNYTLSVEVDDAVGSSDADSFEAVVRPGHCCNGIMDEDEEDVDCGGADCEPCDMRSPIITSFNPDNGAAGNWITIRGRYFGTVAGEVYFSDGSGGWVGPADFPSSVNDQCTNNWSNRQIIVIVPSGAVSGPLRVVRTDGREDVSNDDNGPDLDDFEVNDTARPGLCLANPASGNFNQQTTLQGAGFNEPRTVFFGNEASNFPAISENWTGLTQAEATIPNLSRGRTSVFVSAGGQNSNFLDFTITVDATRLPIIHYINPATGTPNQYITIYGSRFGSYLNETSKVEFYYPAGDITATADGFDFPPECQGRWWYDTYIVVKVPAGLDEGTYEVRVTNRNDLTSDPENFDVIDGVPGPGLCLLDPRNGPVGQLVNAYGDNFLSASGLVRFYNNIEPVAYPFWSNQLISVNVPTDAQTGPVVVSNGSGLSNSLPFTVGICTDNDQCEADEECCPSGTWWAGICREAGTCNAGAPALSGYGWTFTVRGGGGEEGDPCYEGAEPATCDISLSECVDDLVCNESTCTCVEETDDDLGDPSCAGLARALGACQDTLLCPNSPGQCSSYEGETSYVVRSVTDQDCRGFGACDDSCVFNTTIGKCASSTVECSVPKTESGHQAYCAPYGSPPAGRWLINTRESCPLGWTRAILGSNICIQLEGAGYATCDLCPSGFTCFDDGDGDGICAINRNICPSGSVWNSGTDVCLKDTRPECECCCRLGNDTDGTPFSLQDCCPPLNCTGECGSDRVADDPTTWGYCTGCLVRDSGGEVDQADSNAACNCYGHSGKFCDTNNDDYPTGICRDCAVLKDSVADCSLHSDVCCFDANNERNRCIAKGERDIYNDGADLNYCAYYNCETDENICNEDELLIEGIYALRQTCVRECPLDGGRGAEQTCDLDLSTDTGDCENQACFRAYNCIDNDADGENCGYCCCDINDDRCDLINPALECQYVESGACADEDRGVAPDFGLCCGCTNNEDCGGELYCGSDTCCRTRPEITPNSERPADDSNYACRNALITATTSQYMNLSTISGNIIVVGDYVGDSCPAGTQYLASVEKTFGNYGLFARLYRKALRLFVSLAEPILPARLARAYTDPVSTRVYCAIRGNASGKNDPGGFSVLEFRPARLLDPDRLYYVIIQGDRQNNGKSGILSEFNVILDTANSPSSGNNRFNQIDYNNSYVWSFRTLPEQARNNGVCDIDRAIIRPSSYLFNTTSNALNENDLDPDHPTFDKVRDRDKVFEAFAYAYNGQELTPVEGYAWLWNWHIENDEIVKIARAEDLPFSEHSKEQLLSAQSGVTDGRTRAIATIEVTEDTYSNAGHGQAGEADLYVFLCENPWPPVDPETDRWAPWQDTNDNCMDDTGTCHGTNFEIYYCRDAGRTGTYDDLPAILSGKDEAIVRGSSTPGILKEAYFFRAPIPGRASGLEVFNTTGAQTGGSTTLSWINIDEAEGYKIYWGTRQGDYSNYLDVGTPVLLAGRRVYELGGLNNNTVYYFNVTSYMETGAEGVIGEEVLLEVKDIVSPEMPGNFAVAPTDREVRLSWTANTDGDTVGYRVYYGTAALDGPYGYAENVGNVTRADVVRLNNGQIYYFALRAIDASGNLSATSTETSASAVPFSRPANLTAVASSTNNQAIRLSWNLNAAGVVRVIINRGTVSGSYDFTEEIDGAPNSYEFDDLDPNTAYYFMIESVNGDDFTNKSNEASARTVP